MAYRKKRYNTKKKRFSTKKKVTMGKMFRTKKGRYGCYKYVNGRRVAFVSKRRY